MEGFILKKLFTLFIISSLFMQTQCMESAAAIPGPDESGHRSRAFNIMTSDDQRVGPIDEAVLRQSETINALLDDCISDDGTFPQDFVVPLPTISARDFNEVLPHMRYLYENKHLSPEQQKIGIQNALADRDTEHLISLVNNANYLDVPLLLDCCTTILAPRVLSSPDSINALPIEIVRLIIKKNIANKCLIDTESIAQCNGHRDSVNSVCAIQTEDGWRIISCSADNTIRIWDMSGNQLAQCNGHRGSVNSVCAIQTEDGWRIISGSNDRTIRIWDMSGNQLAQCNGHTDLVTSVCAIQTEDGWRIISGAFDRTIPIWDMSGNQLAQCNGHADVVTSVCAIQTEDGCHIISGAYDETIRIWDMSGNQLAQCTGHKGFLRSVCAIQTEDGWRIISCSADNTIRIWDMTGNQLAQCNGHTSYIISVCAIQTEDGWRIISGSHDKTIRIWGTLSLFDKLNKINRDQAHAILNALATIPNSAERYKKIKGIINHQATGFFTPRRIIGLSILGTSATAAGYIAYKFFKK
jgi:WD40 repeat protein